MSRPVLTIAVGSTTTFRRYISGQACARLVGLFRVPMDAVGRAKRWTI